MKDFEMPMLTVLKAEKTAEVNYAPERADDRGWEGFGNCCYR